MTPTLFLIGTISLLLSAFGSVIGVGGGIFLVPLLHLGFSIDLNIVISAVLFSMVPYSMMNTGFNIKNNLVFFWVAVILGLPMIPGTIIGAKLSTYISQPLLRIVFGVVVGVVGLTMLTGGGTWTKKLGDLVVKLNGVGWQLTLTSEDQVFDVGIILMMSFGMLVGSISSLLGLGGGWLITPLLILLFKIPPKHAVGTALCMIVVTSISASVSRLIIAEAVEFYVTATLFVACPLGALVGSQILPKLNNESLEKIIGIGVLLSGSSMLLSTFWGMA